jgi:hypothetical protein
MGSTGRGTAFWIALIATACAVGLGTASAGGPREASSPLERITDVSVVRETLGPLAVTIKDRPARTGSIEGGDFAVYRLTYTNRGSKTFQFVNNRSSAFYGSDDGLGLADDGCGFGSEKGEDVVADTCQYYLEFIKLRPGESVARTITAWTGLQGMGELEAGEFTHTREVQLKRRKDTVREGTLGFTFSVGS